MKEAVLLCLWLVVMGWSVAINNPPVPAQQVVASAEVPAVPAVPEPPKAAPAPKPPLLSRFVLRSNPTLSRKEASRMAKLVERAALRYGLDVFLFAAIIRQESHFKSGATNCSGVGCDGGLGQVNSLWIPVLNLDQNRLVHDDEYNLNVSARILRRVLDQWRHEANAYSRYHNGCPEKRAAYEEKVEKYRRLARSSTT